MVIRHNMIVDIITMIIPKKSGLQNFRSKPDLMKFSSNFMIFVELVFFLSN